MAKASAKALAERPSLGGDSDSAQDRAVVLQPGENGREYGVKYPCGSLFGDLVVYASR
jgi:hypothetical protein